MIVDIGSCTKLVADLRILIDMSIVEEGGGTTLLLRQLTLLTTAVMIVDVRWACV